MEMPNQKGIVNVLPSPSAISIPTDGIYSPSQLLPLLGACSPNFSHIKSQMSYFSKLQISESLSQTP